MRGPTRQFIYVTIPYNAQYYQYYLHYQLYQYYGKVGNVHVGRDLMHLNLASSPGHSHVTLKIWEWSGDEATPIKVL